MVINAYTRNYCKTHMHAIYQDSSHQKLSADTQLPIAIYSVHYLPLGQLLEKERKWAECSRWNRQRNRPSRRWEVQWKPFPFHLQCSLALLAPPCPDECNAAPPCGQVRKEGPIYQETCEKSLSDIYDLSKPKHDSQSSIRKICHVAEAQSKKKEHCSLRWFKRIKNQ